jgi:glutaminase
VTLHRPPAVALCTATGHVHSAGDDGVEFSGEAFNAHSLDGGTHRPVNPMINAGGSASDRVADQNRVPDGIRHVFGLPF